MSNPRIRGLVVFAVMIFVAVVFCVWLPFFGLPGAGIGMALPIIEVPGESLVDGGWILGANFTNTLTSLFFADFMVILFAVLAWRASKGWTQEVPGRFQALVESLVEVLYNFMKGLGGDKMRRAPFLWPLVATIFLLLLAANLSKLFPGFESVGKMHCSHVDLNGYPMVHGATDGSYLLFVDAPLNAGTSQTEATEHACEEYFKGWGEVYKNGFPAQSAEEIRTTVEEYELRVAELRAGSETDLNDAARAELEEKELYIEFAAERIENAEAIEPLEAQLEAIEGEIVVLEGVLAGGVEVEEHAEEAHTEDEAAAEETVATEESAATEEATVTEEATATEEAAVVVEGETGEGEAGSVEEAVAEAEATEGEGELATEAVAAELEDLRDQQTALTEQVNLHYSQVRFPHATVPLSPDQLDRGAVPYLFHITPFFRGAATDLSLTFAYAIMAMVLVQVYGVWAQGPAYFEKFVNISALGNLNKKPLGAIDFVVGLIEIISEIGKIVSLAFRLFGNLFAGGVALLAISFLVSLLIPGVIYGLELIIGTVQALVFAVLTLVFSVQAMESHHGDDHGDHAHDEAHTEAAH